MVSPLSEVIRDATEGRHRSRESLVHWPLLVEDSSRCLDASWWRGGAGSGGEFGLEDRVREDSRVMRRGELLRSAVALVVLASK